MEKKLIQLAMVSILMSPLYSMAAESGHQKDFDVYVPNASQSAEFSAGVLYLRPGGSNDYSVLVNPFNPDVSAPILSPSWYPKGINADFEAGYTLGFRRAFANSGNGINFTWTHLRTSDNGTYPVDTNPPPAQQMTGPFWSIGPDEGSVDAVNGQLKNHFDVINAEIGKNVHFDPDLKLRLFAGISGLFLKQMIDADFSGEPLSGPFTFGVTTNSKYNAAGLRLGLDGEFKACYGFSGVGMLAGNVYIGRQKSETDTHGKSVILTVAGIPENYQNITHNHYTQVVPALDSKLGLKYSHEYGNDKLFTVEAGYMASIYINAIQNYVPSTFVPGSLGILSGSVYLQSLMKSTESFSVDGPYLTFSLKI